MFRITTDTPRGPVTTEIPIETEHAGPTAVDAYVVADVAAQLAALEPIVPDDIEHAQTLANPEE